MNSLIALGVITSFTAGMLSVVIPDLTVDPSFLEEPVMLLAFVLLGRSIEGKARRSASCKSYLSLYFAVECLLDSGYFLKQISEAN